MQTITGITKALPTDVPQLLDLVNSAYRGDTSRQGWTTEANLLDGIRIDEPTLNSYFTDPNVTILKYTDENEQIIGCVYLELRLPKLYVGMFSVSPQLQNNGLGRQLLQAAEDHAKQSGCDTLAMTVISTRHELISWYERRGFNPTGETEPFHDGTKFGIPKQFIELAVLEKAV